MANEVSVEITVEEKAALKALAQLTRGIDDTSKKAEKGFKKMDMALASFAGNLAANAVGATIRGISSAVSSLASVGGQLVSAAQVQEDAINELNSALVRNGEFSEKTSRELQEYASQLQKVTKYGDEAIISQMAFAQSMGASASQSKDILAAATDMASALNIDLNSAVRNISKTLGGYAGELGEVIPELKGLTQEQLRAGQGIDLLASKFAGAASSQVRTFSGATSQLSNVFGDLQETFGGFITQSPVAIAAIKGFTNGLVSLDGLVKSNGDSIREFSNNIIVGGLVGAIDIGIQSIVFFNNVLNGTKNFLNFLTDGALGALQGIQEFGLGVISASIKVKEFLGLNTQGLESMQQAMQKQIEVTQLARELNDQEAAERLAKQEEFNMQMQTLKETMKMSIEEEVAQVKDANNQILQSNIEASQKSLQEKKKAAEVQKGIDKDHFLYTKAWNDRTNKEKVEGIRDSLGAISSLTASGNSELFAIGKAAALAQHGINAAKAVSNALSAAPPPFNFALAALVGTAMAAQGAKIASQKPPAYAAGGFIGGMNGASVGGDNSIATVRTGEQVLNASDQREVLTGLKSGAFSNGSDKLDQLISVLSSQPVIVEVDGIEVARAVRNAKEAGFVA